MVSTVPKSKPKLKKNEAIAILKHCLGKDFDPKVVTLLGIRDYYLDSMGKKGVGDYNIYDGALAVVAPDEYYTFNFNTDPSVVRKKVKGKMKNLARLIPEVYKYYRGKHKNKYNALRMYPEGVKVECTRAGEPSMCSAINLHKGGVGTWSEGCQTIPSGQYGPGKDSFQTVLWRLMDALPHETGNKTIGKNDQKIIKYVLVETKKIDKNTELVDAEGRIIDYETKSAASKPKTSTKVKKTSASKPKAKTTKAKSTKTTAKRKISRTFFFDQVRNTLFSGSLNRKQVTGLTAILDEWEKDHAEKDDRWLAYFLATAHHETDTRIEAIEEYGKGAGKKYGKPDPKTGQIYYGRGLVQLTWKYNYEAMKKAFGLDFVKKPELALDLDNAVKIMFYGMMKGSFGKKLSDFFKPGVYKDSDWRNARRTVNVLNKADLIAGYAKQYYAAISYMN